MKRITHLLAFACVLAGGSVVARPTPAHALMIPNPIQLGVISCCKSLDESKACCYATGCAVSSAGCIQIR